MKHGIGPNIVIQTAHTLVDRLGNAEAERLLARATPFSLQSLPTQMLDEQVATTLVRRLAEDEGERFMRGVMDEAGSRTGEYLLQHRIPGAAQWLLPKLPPRLAMRALLRAIARHSWTFAGSAQLSVSVGDPAVISVRHCPLCSARRSTEPICDFYTGTFRRLLQALVHPSAWVEEIGCEARGDGACRFRLGSRA